MSGMGQTRTLDNVRVTSVKLPMADSKRTFSYVRSGPLTDSCTATKLGAVTPSAHAKIGASYYGSLVENSMQRERRGLVRLSANWGETKRGLEKQHDKIGTLLEDGDDRPLLGEVAFLHRTFAGDAF
jgi:hypothetical protein